MDVSIRALPPGFWVLPAAAAAAAAAAAVAAVTVVAAVGFACHR